MKPVEKLYNALIKYHDGREKEERIWSPDRGKAAWIQMREGKTSFINPRRRRVWLRCRHSHTQSPGGVWPPGLCVPFLFPGDFPFPRRLFPWKQRPRMLYFQSKQSDRDLPFEAVNRGMRVKLPREAVTVRRGESPRSQKTCPCGANCAVLYREPRHPAGLKICAKASGAFCAVLSFSLYNFR